jgi:hypothetical protein
LRQHALGQIIGALEGLVACRRRKLTDPKQPFEGAFAVRPSPPATFAFVLVGKFAGPEGAAIGNLVPDLRDQLLALVRKGGERLVESLAPARARHAPAQ